jgi:hypothetical protein
MADISVTPGDAGVYRVEVTSDGSTSTHRVTATDRMVDDIAPGSDPERVVIESFRFLLEREPKESILGAFDLPVIERYFPGYRNEIRKRLSGP